MILWIKTKKVWKTNESKVAKDKLESLNQLKKHTKPLKVHLKCLLWFHSVISLTFSFQFLSWDFAFLPILFWNSLISWRSTVASRQWGWKDLQTRTRLAPQNVRHSRSGPPPCPFPKHTAPPTTATPGDGAWTMRGGSVARTAPGTCPGTGGRPRHGNGTLCFPGDLGFGRSLPLP